MIRIPFERDRLSHGHLVHPVELAHLVHIGTAGKSLKEINAMHWRLALQNFARWHPWLRS